tara:strand:+ start:261 stop:518 length:258 start_codon:yes stop_codon:yes gene_type:complete
MPKYGYECESCGEFFFAFHSISEVQESCIVCESEKIKKSFKNLTLTTKPANINNTAPGNRVKEFIEDAKEEVKLYKESLSKEEYK